MSPTDSIAAPDAGSRTIDQKNSLRRFWDADPCGTRYLEEQGDFDAHARARYTLEPFIADFADFSSARGKKVLEIGVGMGADYLKWLKAGALATGVDLSSASLERARQRCQIAGYSPDLRVADAERLPFEDDSFDTVYSYGVMHHSPDTVQCIREAWRVLKPGGRAKIMVYHHPSMTGLMLWLRYGIFRGKSLRQSVYDHLESPGTKSYTENEARVLMKDFVDVEVKLEFSPGDLLLHHPSARFQSLVYRSIWRLYPRWLVRSMGGNGKLFLLMTGTKPA